MEVVRVTGVSQKGRNRIREHGDEWRVIRVSSDVQFAAHGTWALLESVQNPKQSRWMRVDAPDQHFRPSGA